MYIYKVYLEVKLGFLNMIFGKECKSFQKPHFAKFSETVGNHFTWDLGLIPGSGRSPGEGNGNPFQYSCLENLMDRGAGRLQSVGLKELDTTYQLKYYQRPSSSVQFSSVTHSCLTLWDCMNCSMPGLPVYHHLPEFTQTHVHGVSDAIQPSHPLSSPSPPALNPSQHQSLFQWVNSSHEVAKVLEFQL